MRQLGNLEFEMDYLTYLYAILCDCKRVLSQCCDANLKVRQ